MRTKRTRRRRPRGITLFELLGLLLVLWCAMAGSLAGARIGSQYGVIEELAGAILGLVMGAVAAILAMFLLALACQPFESLWRWWRPYPPVCENGTCTGHNDYRICEIPEHVSKAVKGLSPLGHRCNCGNVYAGGPDHGMQNRWVRVLADGEVRPYLKHRVLGRWRPDHGVIVPDSSPQPEEQPEDIDSSLELPGWFPLLTAALFGGIAFMVAFDDFDSEPIAPWVVAVVAGLGLVIGYGLLWNAKRQQRALPNTEQQRQAAEERAKLTLRPLGRPAHEYRYCRGYPDRYRRNQRQSSLDNAPLTLLFLGVPLALLGNGTYRCVLELIADVTILGCLVFAVYAALFLAFLLGIVLFFAELFRNFILNRPGGGENARIAPYFEEQIGLNPGPSTTGFAMAKNCQRLDQIALQNELPTLSDLGFDDDLEGREPRWRDPRQGLEIVSTLIQAVKQQSSELAEPQQTLDDLETLASALQKAQEKNARFCLILRSGTDSRILPLGVDLGTGSFS